MEKYESNFHYLKSGEFNELKSKFDFNLSSIGLDINQLIDYAKKCYPFFERINLNQDGSGTYIMCRKERIYDKVGTYVSARVNVVYIKFENFKPVSYEETGEYASL